MLFSNVKSDTEPDTLSNICLECISKNLFCIFPRSDDGYEMPPDTFLPKEICESLVEVYQLSGRTIDDKFVNLFKDKSRAALQRVTIWNSSITDDGLERVLHFHLRDLDLAYCKNLTPRAFELINDWGKNLRTLSIGSDVQIVPEGFLDEDLKNRRWRMENDDGYDCFIKYVLNAPNLHRLVLKEVRQVPKFYATMLRSLPKLTHLDLSCCSDLGDLSYLTYCPNLLSLTLFNCANLQTAIPNICQLTKLR